MAGEEEKSSTPSEERINWTDGKWFWMLIDERIDRATSFVSHNLLSVICCYTDVQKMESYESRYKLNLDFYLE